LWESTKGPIGRSPQSAKKDILAYSQSLKTFLLGRILGKIPTGPENQQTPLFSANSASGKSRNSKAWWKVLVDAEVSEKKKTCWEKKRVEGNNPS